MARLCAAAVGDDYPHEIVASSSCDWPLLGLLTARLRMRPGQLLVDAGCGTGGIGLWLARTLAVRLQCLGLSDVAITQAIARRRHFVPPSQTAFRVASLNDTDLPDQCADGAVCVDALSFAEDRTDTIRELARLLAPGARLTLTRALRHEAAPVWKDQAQAAGLTVEHVDERPNDPEMWARLYRLRIEHADELRRDLGDAQAKNTLTEAHRTLPTLPGRRAVLLTLQRPPGPADTPDNMAHPTSERTPQ
jgi:ubiquinone/menaquinone biosynthesis C-methylase UbiE